MGLLTKKSDAGGKRVVRDLVILNKLGLHARPAAMFVRVANRFSCDIWVEKDNEEVNGKSIMGLMMLAAGCGSRLRVAAVGDSAEEAIQELEQLIARKFDEE
jgi:phosphocarrier protein